MVWADQKESIGNKNNMADSCASEDFSRQVISEVGDEGKKRLQFYRKFRTMHPANREIDGLNLRADPPCQHNKAWDWESEHSMQLANKHACSHDDNDGVKAMSKSMMSTPNHPFFYAPKVETEDKAPWKSRQDRCCTYSLSVRLPCSFKETILNLYSKNIMYVIYQSLTGDSKHLSLNSLNTFGEIWCISWQELGVEEVNFYVIFLRNRWAG